MIRVRDCCQFITPQLLVSEIAKYIPEAVYCCFTTTTFMFTAIIVVWSLKSMCLPRFLFIGCCVSESHAQLANPHDPYHKDRPFVAKKCLKTIHSKYAL